MCWPGASGSQKIALTTPADKRKQKRHERQHMISVLLTLALITFCCLCLSMCNYVCGCFLFHLCPTSPCCRYFQPFYLICSFPPHPKLCQLTFSVMLLLLQLGSSKGFLNKGSAWVELHIMAKPSTSSGLATRSDFAPLFPHISALMLFQCSVFRPKSDDLTDFTFPPPKGSRLFV